MVFHPRRCRTAAGKRKKRKRKVMKRNTKKLNKSVSFIKSTKGIKKQLLHSKPKTVLDAVTTAIKTANKIKQKITPTRVIQVPKTGGILP